MPQPLQRIELISIVASNREKNIPRNHQITIPTTMNVEMDSSFRLPAVDPATTRQIRTSQNIRRTILISASRELTTYKKDNQHGAADPLELESSDTLGRSLRGGPQDHWPS